MPWIQVALALLQELNEDVRGDCIEQSPSSLIRSSELAEMLGGYTAVIATQLDSECREILAEACWQLNVPLFLVQTNGMIGILRIQYQEHTVVESKPEQELFDMRLSCPFPELQAAAGGIDLASLDDEHHSHTPWVYILVKLVQQFKDQNQGKNPGFGDRSWFESALEALRRNSDEQNFVQAKANLRAALMPVSRILSDEAQEVLQQAREQCSAHPSNAFWVVAKAIAEFMENEGEGMPPLAGKIPDMVSDTTSYLGLQNIYHAKAEADFNAVLQRVHATLKETGQALDIVSAQQVRLMCLNVNALRVGRTGKIADDLKLPLGQLTEKLGSWDAADANSAWVVLFHVCDAFHAAHGHFPGSNPGSYTEDVALVKEQFNKKVTELQIGDAISAWKTAHPETDIDDLLNELCRFGNSQLHPVAAVMGGIVSQEVLKVVTEQFLPLNNFVLYNAIDSTTMSIAPPPS